MDCFCADRTPVHCKIVFLDETELVHELQRTSTGQVLLDMVFKHLNLLETAYFGLRFLDHNGQTHWLDPAKKLNKQIKGDDLYTLYFGVKFYAADPCKLLEEITRYQFFLQIKQDILQGRLLVPFELAAELGAFILQSELGDYDPRRHAYGYVSEFRFFPNQSVELEMRMTELHQTLTGQMPSQAELNYLDKVKWLEMYGVDLHPVLGEDHVEYFLGLTPSGIIVLRNKNTVGNYYWPRITKIYFKGRYFMLRVAGKNNDECTYGFETPSKCACKHLWKCCVEHHAFFRLVQVTPATPDIFALGSRFRYSGRTEKQAVHDVQLRLRQPPAFSRNPSKKYQRRLNIGNTEAQQPTEPIIQAPQYQNQEVKFISLPLPADNFESSCNTNTLKSNAGSKKFDSPRSTRSAPWSQPHSKGLYNNSVPPSPRSVRSGSRYRSSSLDSQSSNDSRSCRRRRHKSRTSDNESELSKSSNRSRRKHRKRRSKSRRDSESEQDSRTRERRRSKSKPDKYYELVDSEAQWQKAQLKNRDSNSNTIQQATVVSNANKGHEKSHHKQASSDYSTNSRQSKHRKHRSRSPGDSKWLPDELKKHLEFDLVDTSGMSDLQLKEIPYTIVKTNYSKHVKLKKPPEMKKEHFNPSRPKSYQLGPGPLYNTKALMDEALTNFSYPDSIEGPQYYDGTQSTLSTYSTNFNNPILDNFPNFHRTQHEHSDSGLGV
ncbi:unnamed protein product [Ceutorhynchus assimilis]|uniref:Erythrocyte membrane protein band 4.1-like 4A n=1 Tax=Ceutorhynchus assimilis TaxID=467358 RepID=A0A9N9MAW2_9CUCU|nr:unnamed protein product [Ceutorhynchus assimilis]